MSRVVEVVRQRLLRATAALDAAAVPYAVAGGNAVAAWVSGVDEAAVRNPGDVEIIVRRADLEAAASALEQAGFSQRHSARLDMFLDGPDARERDCVRLVFAAEKVRPDYRWPAPDVEEVVVGEPAPAFRLLTLDALVRMTLTSYRDRDRTDLRDLLEVGLIDESWCGRLPGELAGRLRFLIEHPED